MEQRGHTWIALRAIGLIQQDSKTVDLAKVLVPKAKEAYIGCWLPDMQGFKKGHGVVGNHTFKNAPYNGTNKSHFVLTKNNLLAKLDPNMALYDYIKNNSTLDSAYWNGSYKAIQNDGEHLPDCLSSLFDTIADMLLLGDVELDNLVPGKTGYGDHLSPECALSKEQASTFFFMLSHYVADCFMPCHADKRTLAAYEYGGLHEGWERQWKTKIGTYFDKEKLSITSDTSEQVISEAIKLDTKFNLDLSKPLSWPNTGDDIWEMAIYWCRASFAFSCNLFPLEKYPFDSSAKPKFKDYFTDAELAEYDRIVMESAIYAVASTWKVIWRKFLK